MAGAAYVFPPPFPLIKCGPHAKRCERVQTCSTAGPSGDRKWDTDEVWWDAEPLHCWFVRLLRAPSLSGLHYLLPDGRKRAPWKAGLSPWAGVESDSPITVPPTSLLRDRMWKLTWISAWGPSLQGFFYLFIYLFLANVALHLLPRVPSSHYMPCRRTVVKRCACTQCWVPFALCL